MDGSCDRVSHRPPPSPACPQPHSRNYRSSTNKPCNQSDTVARRPQRVPTTTQHWPLPVGDERRTVSMRWPQGARMWEGGSMLLIDALAINRRVDRGSACPRGVRPRCRRLNPGARRYSAGGFGRTASCVELAGTAVGGDARLRRVPVSRLVAVSAGVRIVGPGGSCRGFCRRPALGRRSIFVHGGCLSLVPTLAQASSRARSVDDEPPELRAPPFSPPRDEPADRLARRAAERLPGS